MNKLFSWDENYAPMKMFNLTQKNIMEFVKEAFLFPRKQFAIFPTSIEIIDTFSIPMSQHKMFSWNETFYNLQ